MAAYIGAHADVDFVLVNRTFASLESVAYWTAGRWLSVLFKALTFGGWPDRTLENWQAIKGFKILGADPMDRVITDMAGLKQGVARSATQAAQGVPDNKFALGCPDHLIEAEQR